MTHLDVLLEAEEDADAPGLVPVPDTVAAEPVEFVPDAFASGFPTFPLALNALVRLESSAQVMPPIT